MNTIPDYQRGFKDGIRSAVTWLHNEGQTMNDPQARMLYDLAADHLGKEFSEKVQSLKRQYARRRAAPDDSLDSKSWTGR